VGMAGAESPPPGTPRDFSASVLLRGGRGGAGVEVPLDDAET